MPKTTIICASPRQNGNCDFACSFLTGEIIYLRDYEILPCTACGYCEKHFNSCTIKDQAKDIFAKILSAEQVIFVSPIYFYALPAQFKALIDRSQQFYFAKTKREIIVSAILIAGRDKGEKLFAGSLLSLKYFCRSLGFELNSSLTLTDLDQKNALQNNNQAQKKLRHYWLSR